MRFYDALQLDPAALKLQIRSADTSQERRRMQAVLVIRSVLIVAFAMVFITPLSLLFGPENNAMAVTLFCILLAIRFVDFGYCITDSLCNLGVVFLILLVAPILASLLHPILAFCVHFGALLTILLMTSHQPEMGNGGLYGFAYVFLTGNPVTGDLFWKRCILTLLGYLLCGAILYAKHRHKHTEVRFHQVAKEFHLSCEKSRWQMRIALGVSLALTLGSLFHLERFMWAGFACSSLLSRYSSTAGVKERFFHRILGAIIGSLLFFIVYQATPEAFHSLLGILGGICLGFCTDYRYKTVLNCFGALLTASGLYGIKGAVLLRIWDNLLGVTFGYVFFLLYRQLVDKRFNLNKTNAQEPTA